MEYFQILRLALGIAYMQGKYTKEQASEIAQQINRAQAEFAGRYS